MVHIGNKIKEEVNRQRVSINKFAEQINKSRTVVYDIFERETIDTGLLLRISEVLEHDFFRYYHLSSTDLNEPSAEYKSMKMKMEEISRELNEAQKEILYLKKINTLLEEKLKNK
ncbi:MAG: hypothetical protein ACK4ND_08590 [Cytophagaceae bacterium]